MGVDIRKIASELLIRMRTDGADEVEDDLRNVTAAGEETVAVAAQTEKQFAAVEKQVAALEEQYDPLVKIERERAEALKTVSRIEQSDAVSKERTADLVKKVNEQYARQRDELEGVAAAQEKAGFTLSGFASGLASVTSSTLGFAAAFLGLKTAQIEALDNTTKLGAALSILGRVLPIAAVIALGLAALKAAESIAKMMAAIQEEAQELARVQREADAQVSAAIASTGGVAERSIQDIKAVASELQNLTNVADEVSTRAGAQLLTFTNIGGENFDRTLRVTVDVAARLDRDVEQVALQLGKALNDPARNLSALSESGIQFSATQRQLITDMVDMGETAAAQAIILKELERQFEGAAAAARTADGGVIALGNALGDLKEAFGDGIVGQTADEMNRLAVAVADPTYEGFARTLGNINGFIRSIGIGLAAGVTQGVADASRGFGSFIGKAVTATRELVTFDSAARRANGVTRFVAQLERVTTIDVAPALNFIGDLGRTIDKTFSSAAKSIVDVRNRLQEFDKQFERRTDNPLGDFLKGGVFFGGANALIQEGRRRRERSLAPASQSVSDILPVAQIETALQALGLYRRRAEQAVEGFANDNRDIVSSFTQFISGSVGAITNANATAFERGFDRLESLKSELQSQLDQSLFDFSDIDASEIAAKFEAAIPNITDEQSAKVAILVGEIDKLQKALGDTTDEATRTAAALRVAFDPVGDIEFDNKRLEQLIAAARIGPDELEMAERRFRIEDEIARTKLEAARLGQKVSAEQTVELEKQLALNEKLRSDLEIVIDERRAAEGFADDLSRELNFAADDFVDRLVRNGRAGFRKLGRDLKNILLDSVLNPFRLALRNLLNGVFGSLGGQSGGVVKSGASGLLGPALQLGAGAFASVQGAKGVADFLGFEKKTDARRFTTSILGGAGAGAALGSIIPGVGTVIGAVVGAAIGAGIGLIRSIFGGKRSSFEAGATFDPLTGAFEHRAQDGSGADQNAQIRDAIVKTVSDTVGALQKLIGGELRDNPATAELETRLQVAVDDREGIRASFGRDTTPARFDNTEAGATAAINELVKITIGAIEGGNDALRDVAQELIGAGKPIEEVIERMQTLSAVIDATNKPVDEFKQKLETAREAFAGLNTQTGALGEAFRGVISQITEDLNDRNQKALDEFLNPRLAQVNQAIEQLTARRAAAEELAGEGGNVDFALLDEVARRTVVSGFNIEQRLSAGADPALASLEAVEQSQRQELAALDAAITAGFATLADRFALQRAQGFEAAAAFRALPEEDQLRLSGKLEGFEDFAGRIGRIITEINLEYDRAGDDLERYQDRLRETIAVTGRQLTDYDRFLAQFDLAGTPRAQLGVLRTQLEDQKRAALTGPEAGREAARDNVLEIAQEILTRTDAQNATSPAAQADRAFARQAVQDVRAVIGDENSFAERGLALSEQTVETLRDIRELLSAADVDPARLAALAASLPEGNVIGELAGELAALRAADADQATRIDELLAAVDPNSAFSGAIALAPANDERIAAALVSAPLQSPAATTASTSGLASSFVLAEPANDADASSRFGESNVAPLPRVATPLTQLTPAPSSGQSFTIDEQVLSLLAAIATKVGETTSSVDSQTDAGKRRDENRDDILRGIKDALQKRAI